MSQPSTQSRQSGDSRRRRSRGGRNRNQDKRGGDRGDRGPKSGRSEELRPQGPRPPRNAPPVRLSWWQKLLMAIGLYKPQAPARPERKPQTGRTEGEARPPKSNTRNARSDAGAEGRGETGETVTAPKRRTRGEGGGEGRSEGRGEGRSEGRGSARSRGGDRSSVESARVYVGNLSYDVTEQDLQELFKGIGGVRHVEIVYNRNTHRSKGYGFVEMLHKDEAVRAVEVLHDQHFMGRKLLVSGAKSKGEDEREDAEERTERAPRPVVLAPLPAAAAAAPAVEAGEPVIQTIVEQVVEAPAAVAEVVATPEEAPAAAEEVAAIAEAAAPADETVVAEESAEKPPVA